MAVDGKCVVNTKVFTRKTLHFMTFCICDFITDQLIVSYQEIFLSIPVEDKLATPAVWQ